MLADEKRRFESAIELLREGVDEAVERCRDIVSWRVGRWIESVEEERSVEEGGMVDIDSGTKEEV